MNYQLISLGHSARKREKMRTPSGWKYLRRDSTNRQYFAVPINNETVVICVSYESEESIGVCLEKNTWRAYIANRKNFKKEIEEWLKEMYKN